MNVFTIQLFELLLPNCDFAKQAMIIISNKEIVLTKLSWTCL